MIEYHAMTDRGLDAAPVLDASQHQQAILTGRTEVLYIPRCSEDTRRFR